MLQLLKRLNLFTFTFYWATSSFAQNINIANPSFEGPCNNCSWNLVVSGWTNCGAGTADGLPGCWGVNGSAQGGNTYLGLIGGESISQQLSAPMKAGVTYNLSLWISHDPNYSLAQVPGPSGCTSTGIGVGSEGGPGVLQIWAGNSLCSFDQLLHESVTITWTTWKLLQLSITPGKNYQYLTIVEPLVNKNILLDNLSESIVIPIQLLSFSAQKKGNDVKLAWSTVSEVNNDKFIVEKSENGIDFLAVGELKGAGNSSLGREYFFTDSYLLPEYVFYRLVQIDFNGKKTYSHVIKINIDQELVNQVSISPTIVTNKTEFSFRFTQQAITTIVLFDALGRLVLEKQLMISPGLHTEVVDLSLLPMGLYIVSVLNNDGWVQQLKLMKE